MATVYVARHTLIGRMVAIKLLHSQFARDESCVRRFMNEGRAAGTLGHPNIVESTDMGFAPDGAPFLVLELLDGCDLSTAIGLAKGFTVERAARIAVQLASALATAHDHQIIHRDLKPENIFLIPGEKFEDHVKILDFGISKFLRGSHATQQGALMGTPDFMAPEQISAPNTIDRRIDIYALGAVIYHMLAGRAPFHDAPFPLILSKIQFESPVPLMTLRGDLPPDLVAMVEKAMARTPDARYQSMEDVLQALIPHAGASVDELITRRRALTPPPVHHATSATMLAAPQTPSESFLRLAAASTPGASQHTPPPGLAGFNPGDSLVVNQPRSRWQTVATIATLLAAGGAIASVWVTRHRGPSETPAIATAAPAAPADRAPPPQSADDALALYLDEAERLATEGRMELAVAMLAKARDVEGHGAELDIRRARVIDAVETSALRLSAEQSLARGDRQAAIDAAKEVLDRSPDDPGATAVLERAAAELVADAPAGKSGQLFVNANVRGTVYLDDVPIGKTPIREHALPLGRHTVEVRRPGYTPASKRVEVTAKRSARLSFELTPRPDSSADTLPTTNPDAAPDDQLTKSAPPTHTPASSIVPTVPVATAPTKPAVVADLAPTHKPPPTETTPKPTPPPPPTVEEIAAPRLPATHKVKDIKELTRVLRIIEIEAIDRGEAPESVVKGVTAKLARSAFDSFAPGKVITLRPSAIYYLIVKSARAGQSGARIASKLQSEHEAGRL